MTTSYLVSDLHGNIELYNLLFREIIRKKPSFVFIAGDLLPHVRHSTWQNGEHIPDFMHDFLIPGFKKVRNQMGCNYPEVFVIMGNDDPGSEEPKFIEGAKKELWIYLNTASFKFGPYTIYGYPYVPPTPFRLKDREKYDVTVSIDANSIPPDKGFRTVEADYNTSTATIANDLEKLSAESDMSKAICLFHSPPAQSLLDQAEVKNPETRMIHVGSMAIRDFIRDKQPYLTLHGHIHESTRLSGSWQQKFGRTVAFNAAHDGKGLSVVQFEIDNPELAERRIITD
ncbi:MAG: metallophosphoesterase [Lentimicrobiaceae bacterium]|nr:metallophosphoesterase [Lentimicrobiaceae bacterium]